MKHMFQWLLLFLGLLVIVHTQAEDTEKQPMEISQEEDDNGILGVEREIDEPEDDVETQDVEKEVEKSVDELQDDGTDEQVNLAGRQSSQPKPDFCNGCRKIQRLVKRGPHPNLYGFSHCYVIGEAALWTSKCRFPGRRCRAYCTTYKQGKCYTAERSIRVGSRCYYYKGRRLPFGFPRMLWLRVHCCGCVYK